MSAVDEYHKYRAAAEITTLAAGIAGLADAAIAELEAENERLKYEAEVFMQLRPYANHEWPHVLELERGRKQAEAEVRRLNARYAHLEVGDVPALLDRLQQAEAELAALRQALEIIGRGQWNVGRGGSNLTVQEFARRAARAERGTGK